jgi:hypothetical protein
MTTSDLLLRRKWTFRAHGRQVVLVKRLVEHTSHVLMKALLWALYLPSYPALKVEVAVGDRYKPDVVEMAWGDPYAQPRFWGEAGQVGVEKIRALAKRYPHTHFALAKWATPLHHALANVTEALQGRVRTVPFDLICFPADSAERFIDDCGEIQITHADLVWQRLEPDRVGT